jgi:hypothetical protein
MPSAAIRPRPTIRAVHGTPVNALVPTDRDYDPWVGMPRQSAIPVRLHRLR